MKPVFSVDFASRVGDLSSIKGALRKKVEEIIADPLAHDGNHEFPWEGHFEKKYGASRIVYGVCRECRSAGCDSEHPDCADRDDDTVVFRTIYTVF